MDLENINAKLKYISQLFVDCLTMKNSFEGIE